MRHTKWRSGAAVGRRRQLFVPLLVVDGRLPQVMTQGWTSTVDDPVPRKRLLPNRFESQLQQRPLVCVRDGLCHVGWPLCGRSSVRWPPASGLAANPDCLCGRV